MQKSYVFMGILLVIGLSVLYVSVESAQLAQAAPQTDVSGAITSDTTWYLASSPYVVTGDVTVNTGVTLT